MRPAFKAIVVGESSVGKTSFLQVLCNKKDFASVAPTVGVDYAVFRSDDIRVGFYDTAGAERYFSITRTYFRNTDMAFVFIDLSDPAPFAATEAWFKEAEPHAKHVVLIGSKADEQTDAGLAAMRFASDELKVPHFIVSSKSGEGLQEVTEYFTRVLMSTQPRYIETIEPITDGQKRYCC